MGSSPLHLTGALERREYSIEGENIMSPEIHWLTMTTLLTALLFIPYAYNRISKISFVAAILRVAASHRY